MLEKEEIIQLVYDAIDEAALNREEGTTLEKSPDTVLFGKSGVFDSMGLVNLIVAVEQRIQDKFDKALALADENALSQKKNPFATIDSLADYILMLMEAENG
jgi:acyl carrier protein